MVLSAIELTRTERWGAFADRVLHTLAARVFLSVCITLSLIPFTTGSAARAIDYSFLAIFSVEFFLRLLSLKAPQDGDANAPGRRKLGTYTLLVVDFVALMTFIPWTDDRTLRLLRLLRIVLLLGYWAPVLRDIAAILRREDRLRQVILMGFAVATLSLVGAVILDALAVQGVDFDNDGKGGAGDQGFLVRLWWAFRQIQDPGNMIATPLHLAAVFVSLALTVFGLFMVSFLIGLGTSVVSELVQLNRHRPPGFSDHTVIVGLNPSTQNLLLELLRYYQKLFTVPRYALVGDAAKRPDYLDQAVMSHVVYREGPVGEPGFLERVDTGKARRIVVMPDLTSGNPDADTAGVILSVREKAPNTPLVAEIVDLANAPAARVAGGRNTTLVGTERLLGLVMVASVHRPGLADLLHVLMSSEGREIYTYIYDRPDAPGDGSLPCNAPPRLDALFHCGMLRQGDERIFPLGFITFDRPDVAEPPSWNGYVPPAAHAIVLNGDAPENVRHLRGIVGISESFSGIQSFARDLMTHGLPVAPAPDATAPPVEQEESAESPGSPTVGNEAHENVDAWDLHAAPHAFERVVVLGYRPAVISLIEALVAGHPGVDILLCVHNQRARERAAAALSEHSLNLADASFPGMTWTFAKTHAERRFETWDCFQNSETTRCGSIRLQVTDWTNDATLICLPGWDCAIGQTDAAFLAGGLTARGDGWTALAVLKIAELKLFGGIDFKPEFRVVAQVNDPAVGHRLETRYREALGPSAQIRVLSSRKLRAYAMFQSVAVPGFEMIYAQLLGPWGQSFQRVTPKAGVTRSGRITFSQLARELHEERQMLLVAVEVAEETPSAPNKFTRPQGPRLVVCPLDTDDDAAFEHDQITSLWVIADCGLA